MANEISISLGMRVRKTIAVTDDFKADVPFEVVQRTLTGTRKFANTQTVGFATHEALAVGADLASKGYAYIRNLDATNKVQVGVLVNSSFYCGGIEILAGDVNLVTLSTDVIYVKAFVAACELDYLIIER